MRAWLVAAAFLLLGAPGSVRCEAPAGPRALHPADDIPLVGYQRSVLRVDAWKGGEAYGGSGSWTVHGVLTAWHCVEGADRVEVRDYLGRKHKAWGWWRQGKGEDVAIVRLEKPLDLPQLPLAKAPFDPQKGMKPGWTCGYWGIGDAAGLPTVAAGYVVTVSVGSRGKLGVRFYGTTIGVVRGMSGGPLVVDGEVYAVVSHDTIPPGLSFFAFCDLETCPLSVGTPK